MVPDAKQTRNKILALRSNLRAVKSHHRNLWGPPPSRPPTQEIITAFLRDYGGFQKLLIRPAISCGGGIAEVLISPLNSHDTYVYKTWGLLQPLVNPVGSHHLFVWYEGSGIKLTFMISTGVFNVSWRAQRISPENWWLELMKCSLLRWSPFQGIAVTFWGLFVDTIFVSEGGWTSFCAVMKTHGLVLVGFYRRLTSSSG